MTVAEFTHKKLSGFDLIQTPYKKVGNHEIRVDIIIPQTEYTGERPVLARFHGGGLVTGDSLTMEWFPQWLFDITKKHNAVIVSPNYRLMPECTGLDIVDDIEDFWTWLHSSATAKLLSSLPRPTSLDLNRILTAGESAGGLLSICLALSHPDEIRAATAGYPSVDMASEHFSTPAPSGPITEPPIPASIIGDYIAQLKPGAVRSSSHIPEMFNEMYASIHYGELTRLYERGLEKESDRSKREWMFPIERLDRGDVKVPRGGISILQGIEDVVVPKDGPEKFVEKARKVLNGTPGQGKVRLTLREGAHGFDGEASYEEEWVQEYLRGPLEAWLQ